MSLKALLKSTEAAAVVGRPAVAAPGSGLAQTTSEDGAVTREAAAQAAGSPTTDEKTCQPNLGDTP
jgi:hypothetical protein